MSFDEYDDNLILGGSRDPAPASAPVVAETEPRTYDELFPSLVAAPRVVREPVESKKAKKATGAVPLKVSNITTVFQVPVDEAASRAFSLPSTDSAQSKAIKDVMQKFGVDVETSLDRKRNLTVVINGKHQNVLEAKKALLFSLQKVSKQEVYVPKKYLGFLLGKNGTNLAELCAKTSTKIQLPRSDEESEMVTISGTVANIEKARAEIERLVVDKDKTASVTIEMDRSFHPFIINANIPQLEKEFKVRVHIPPSSSANGDIRVAGEKDGVNHVVALLQGIYNEKNFSTRTLSVDIKKKQHRYILGPKGANLTDIFNRTGVAVVLPPAEDTSETVTIRGPQENLVHALTAVLEKAESVMSESVEAPAFLHRHIIGKKGANVKELVADHPEVHIQFNAGSDLIELEGPPQSLEVVRDLLQQQVDALVLSTAVVELNVEPQYHRYVIGKGGQNAKALFEKYSVQLKVPHDDDKSSIIRIEGSPENVQLAKEDVMKLVNKKMDEKSIDVIIDTKYHKFIIGQKGANMKEFREKYPEVTLLIPPAKEESQIVKVVGPRADVVKVKKELEDLVKTIAASNYQLPVSIFKKFHSKIIGKKGENIKKITTELKVRLDFPPEKDESDVIMITGTEKNCQDARARLLSLQKELANIVSIEVKIDPKFHQSVKGRNNVILRNIQDDCNGVTIYFPKADAAKIDIVTIRGPDEDAKKAQQLLLAAAADHAASSFTEELHVPREHHKFIFGRGGAGINAIRTATNTRIGMSGQDDPENDAITIIGKEDDVHRAAEMIKKIVHDLENVVKDTVIVPLIYQQHFRERKGKVLTELVEEFGGISISFAKGEEASEEVQLKGGSEYVAKCKARIEEIVEELRNQVTIEVPVAAEHFPAILGSRGVNVRQVIEDYKVNIQLPRRKDDKRPRRGKNAAGAPAEGEETTEDATAEPQSENVDAEPVAESNAAADGEPAERKGSFVTISGSRQNVELAKEALLKFVPLVEQFPIPNTYHSHIIGKQGAGILNIIKETGCFITFPKGKDSNVALLKGVQSVIDTGKAALQARMAEIDAEEAEQKLRSFVVEFEVNSKSTPAILGQKGATIQELSKKYDVRIDLNNDREGAPRERKRGGKRGDDANGDAPAAAAPLESEGVDGATNGDASAENGEAAAVPETATRTNPATRKVKITGLEASAKACRDAILEIVRKEESQVEIQVEIDRRAHRFIIGRQGMNVRKLMDEYKVNIKFPRGEEDPDLVTIRGEADACEEVKEILLQQQDDQMEEIIEAEERRAIAAEYTRRTAAPAEPTKAPREFSVTGAPWQSPPAAQDSQAFPAMRGSTTQNNAPTPAGAWGVRRF